MHKTVIEKPIFVLRSNKQKKNHVAKQQKEKKNHVAKQQKEKKKRMLRSNKKRKRRECCEATKREKEKMLAYTIVSIRRCVGAVVRGRAENKGGACLAIDFF